MGDRLARVLLIDHAGQRHQAVRPGAFGALSRLDGEGGRIFGNTCKNRDAALDGFGCAANDGFLFIGGK